MNRERYWSRIADDFEKRVSYVTGEECIEAIKRELIAQKLTGKVLEIGSGNGTYSEGLALEAERLYVTDFSDQMVSICKERFRHLNHVEIEKQDCFSLTYSDAYFDTVVMVNLLHVIPDPEKAIRESRRVLRKKGRLVVVSFTTRGMSLLGKIGMIYRFLKVFGRPPAESRALTVGLVASMLKDEGFTVETARLLGETSKVVFVTATV